MKTPLGITFVGESLYGESTEVFGAACYIQAILKKLDSMGSSKAIADFLLPEFQGPPDSCSECPIAKYIEHEITFPEPVYHRVFQDSIFLREVLKDIKPSNPRSHPLFRIHIPEKVQTFVQDFDDGKFDHLCNLPLEEPCH